MEDISEGTLKGLNKSEMAWICMNVRNSAIGGLLLPG